MSSAQLFRIGKPKNGQRHDHQPKEVRFELAQIDDAGSGDTPQQSLGVVQEKFVGFFEVSEKCVPFDVPPTCDQSAKTGFPEVASLMDVGTSYEQEPAKGIIGENLKFS